MTPRTTRCWGVAATPAPACAPSRAVVSAASAAAHVSARDAKPSLAHVATAVGTVQPLKIGVSRPASTLSGPGGGGEGWARIRGPSSPRADDSRDDAGSGVEHERAISGIAGDHHAGSRARNVRTGGVANPATPLAKRPAAVQAVGWVFGGDTDVVGVGTRLGLLFRRLPLRATHLGAVDLLHHQLLPCLHVANLHPPPIRVPSLPVPPPASRLPPRPHAANVSYGSPPLRRARRRRVPAWRCRTSPCPAP